MEKRKIKGCNARAKNNKTKLKENKTENKLEI